MAVTTLRTTETLGVRSAAGDVGSAAHAVVRRALERKGGYGVLCNVHVLMTARRDDRLRRALEHAWAVFPDGAPIAWLQRRNGIADAVRVGGPDLLPAVIEAGLERGIRHAFFGSTPLVIERLRDSLETRFPGIRIVHAHAPEVGAESDPETLSRLVDSRPDIVWCAFGAPKQELWMHRTADLLAPALVLGVGAAFDFHSGLKQRAPRRMQALGLEWLHRLVSEPRRLGRRYLVTNLGFLALVLRNGFGSGRGC